MPLLVCGLRIGQNVVAGGMRRQMLDVGDPFRGERRRRTES